VGAPRIGHVIRGDGGAGQALAGAARPRSES
jgi:hypothetical protein